jgi:hypothetical protein
MVPRNDLVDLGFRVLAPRLKVLDKPPQYRKPLLVLHRNAGQPGCAVDKRLAHARVVISVSIHLEPFQSSYRWLESSRLKRIGATPGVIAPEGATAVVLIAGLLTPGYDPLRRTISRLAEPGLPAAGPVELAIFTVGLAMIGLALSLGPGGVTGRLLLGIAGFALLAAAVVRLDPSSPTATIIHRLATAIAMLALTASALVIAPALRNRPGWRGYGPLSFGLGAAAAGLLLIGLALLSTAFSAWGAWERCFLALPMTWMVLVSARVLRTSSTEPMRSLTAAKKSWATSVSAEDTMKATAASVSRSGS